MSAQRLMHVLWPAFIVAGAAEALFFSVFDPSELSIFGEMAGMAPTAVYSAGFFFFWAVATASSVLTCFFQRTAADLNKCPIEDPTARPVGCPKRDDPNAWSS